MSDMRDNLIGMMAEYLPHPSDDEYADAADAILAALPDMVKPLVWRGEHYAYCTLPFCQYQIREAECGFYVQADGYASACIASELESVEAAKAAAQAHYVAAIMQAFGVVIDGGKP